MLLATAGCGVHFEHLPAGSVVGRDSFYDYSPTAIRTGNLVKIWWCGGDSNPYDVTQFSDTIQYESIDLTTNKHDGPVAVLGESQFKWDSVYTCNPKVVQGKFVNPLGNGKTYVYALYYVGLGPTGNNSIGVAFLQRRHCLEKISPAHHQCADAGGLWGGPARGPQCRPQCEHPHVL